LFFNYPCNNAGKLNLYGKTDLLDDIKSFQDFHRKYDHVENVGDFCFARGLTINDVTAKKKSFSKIK